MPGPLPADGISIARGGDNRVRQLRGIRQEFAGFDRNPYLASFQLNGTPLSVQLSWYEKGALRSRFVTSNDDLDLSHLGDGYRELPNCLNDTDPVYHARFLIEFGGGGLLLFAMSLALEWRFDDAE